MKTKISVIIILLSVFCLSFADESARLMPHYSHPLTGVIEDSGNNPVLGQSMIENLACPYAFFEADDDKFYTTVRFKLADQLGAIDFYLELEDDRYKKLSYIKTAISNVEVEYKLISSKKPSLIRVDAEVIPMSRNVIFYLDFKEFFSGNTDFIVLSEASTRGEYVDIGEADVLEVGVSDFSSTDIGYDHGLLLATSPELQKYINPEVESSKTSENPVIKLNKLEVFLLVMLLLSLFVLALVLLMYAYKLYVFTKFLAEDNDRLEKVLYE